MFSCFPDTGKPHTTYDHGVNAQLRSSSVAHTGFRYGISLQYLSGVLLSSRPYVQCSAWPPLYSPCCFVVLLLMFFCLPSLCLQCYSVCRPTTLFFLFSFCHQLPLPTPLMWPSVIHPFLLFVRSFSFHRMWLL